jgi:hypothetical protein
MSSGSLARKLSAALFVLFALISVTAHAALLVPGTGLLTPVEPDPVGGTILFPGVPVPFTGTGPFGYTGTLTSTVITGDVTNPLGGLTFTYLLHNNATSATALERINMPDFSGFSTDVSYQLIPGNVAPSQTDRSFGPGAIVGWDYTGAPSGLGTILPGQTSMLMVVQTNAPQFDLTQSASIIDGSIASVATIGPSPTLISPEPALSLTFAAVGAVAMMRRRCK